MVDRKSKASEQDLAPMQDFAGWGDGAADADADVPSFGGADTGSKAADAEADITFGSDDGFAAFADTGSTSDDNSFGGGFPDEAPSAGAFDDFASGDGATSFDDEPSFGAADDETPSFSEDDFSSMPAPGAGDTVDGAFGAASFDEDPTATEVEGDPAADFADVEGDAGWGEAESDEPEKDGWVDADDEGTAEVAGSAQAPEKEPAAKSKTKSFVTAALAAGLLGGVVFVAWPNLFPNEQPFGQNVASAPSPQPQPTFPDSLPPVGFDEPSPVAQPQVSFGEGLPPIASDDEVAGGLLPSFPDQSVPLDSAAGEPGSLPMLPGADGPMDVADTPTSIEDDLFGGEGRAGIGVDVATAPVEAASVDVPTQPVPVEAEADVTSILSDMPAVEDLMRRVALLEERIVVLERQAGESAPVSADAASSAVAERVDDVRTSQATDGLPPLKPMLVEGVTLREFSRDTAWVSTASGNVEVRPGDRIPGAGIMVRVRPYGGSYLLATTEGLVTR